MRHDVECPYCGEGQDINHDDGQGYAEDQTHTQTCSDCDKEFVFTTYVTFHYTPSKADCLNGSDHDYKPTVTVPREYTEMQCTMCDETRPCTPEEMARLLTPAEKA
jgi:hypothetical protein